MYLIIYLAVLPFLIGISVGYVYKVYDSKCKLNKEIDGIFNSYKGE